MPSFALRTLGALAMLCIGAAAAAHDAKEIPNLVGEWVGQGVVLGENGYTSGTTRLVITEQKDGLFKGEYHWKLDPQHMVQGHSGKELAFQGFETVIGVIDWDNRTFYIADHGDTGIRKGEMLDADTMRTIYVEAGSHAIVGRVTFRRASSVEG